MASIRGRERGAVSVALAAALAFGVASALVLGSCAGDKDSVKGSGGAKDVDEDEDDDDEAVDDGLETVDGDGGSTVDIGQILTDCGVGGDILNNPNQVLVQKTIRSWPKTFAGATAAPLVGNVNYRVNVVTVISILSTARETKQTTDFEITATPSQAEAKAAEKVAPLRGASTATSLTLEERTNLMGQVPAWDGVYCTISPVKQLATNRGANPKVIKFTPAVPFAISPLATAARYAAEIGNGRTFEGIEAEIVGSSDPAWPKGKKATGRVVVTKVQPTLTLQINGGGGTQTIQTDAAFRIEWDFGGAATTVGLGLMPSQTVFISHGEKTFKAIVADTGFAEGGISVLSEDL
jgi:hypothetical protein